MYTKEALVVDHFDETFAEDAQNPLSFFVQGVMDAVHGNLEGRFSPGSSGEFHPVFLYVWRLADQLAGTSNLRMADPNIIRELDLVQRNAEILMHERSYAVGGLSAITRGLTYLAYQGNTDDMGLPEVAGVFERAAKKSSELIHPASEALIHAKSQLGLHGLPVRLNATEENGTIRAWGPLSTYGKSGLGLEVVGDFERPKIVDVGHDSFELVT